MIVLIRGGGDLASGTALRLVRAGLRVVITELPEPLAVRRLVSFSEAVYDGEATVEGITGRRVLDPVDTLRILQVLAKGYVPVVVDPEAEAVRSLHPHVVVDARMLKRRVELIRTQVKLILGLGPGFVAGENCHAVIETKRGHRLGRVIWQGGAEEDSEAPEPVGGIGAERVLRAPGDGILITYAQIGDLMEAGQQIADVGGKIVVSPYEGVLRGLLRSNLTVKAGDKIGDIDPRKDPESHRLVSDKSLAVGGAVLEAILSRLELRPHLWA